MICFSLIKLLLSRDILFKVTSEILTVHVNIDNSEKKTTSEEIINDISR